MSERRCQKDKSRTFDLLKEDVDSNNGRMKCFSALQGDLLQRQNFFLKMLQKNTEKVQAALCSTKEPECYLVIFYCNCSMCFTIYK